MVRPVITDQAANRHFKPLEYPSLLMNMHAMKMMRIVVMMMTMIMKMNMRNPVKFERATERERGREEGIKEEREGTRGREEEE